MKRRSEYSALDWAKLSPEARWAIEQNETDIAVGRHGPDVIAVRAVDGISTTYIDRQTRAPVTAPTRRL